MMKTAEEVARKIWDNIPRDLGADRWIDYLAQALTAYAEERVREYYQPALKEARAEALEEAGKMAEFHSCNERCDGDEGCLGAIYKDIRALAERNK